MVKHTHKKKKKKLFLIDRLFQPFRLFKIISFAIGFSFLISAKFGVEFVVTGKNFLQWDGSQAQLVVTEAELVKEVLTDRDGVFSKGKTKAFMRRLLGDGLVISQGQKWAKVRKLANYAFHAESLKVVSLTQCYDKKKLHKFSHHVALFLRM